MRHLREFESPYCIGLRDVQNCYAEMRGRRSLPRCLEVAEPGTAGKTTRRLVGIRSKRLIDTATLKAENKKVHFPLEISDKYSQIQQCDFNDYKLLYCNFYLIVL